MTSQRDNAKAIVKAYDEARRNVLGDRRGLALIAAYEDSDLNSKLTREYLHILAREGLLTRDEARHAANIAKLPELLRKT